MTSVALSERLDQAAAARPDLAKRIEAARELLTRHLADRAAGIIRGRVTPTGTRWTVQGSKGAAYIVTQAATGWGCDCPDHAHRGVVCKHIMAVKALCLAHEGQAAPVAVLTGDALTNALTQAARAERMARPARTEWVEEV